MSLKKGAPAQGKSTPDTWINHIFQTYTILSTQKYILLKIKRTSLRVEDITII